MNGSNRGNYVIGALVAAIVIPKVQQKFGITLTTEDVFDALALGGVIAHSAAAIFVRYFPPPKQETTK